jgi:uncharacterized membrane protein
MNVPSTDPKPPPTRVPPPHESDKIIAQLRLVDPFRWLAAGARDLGAHPGIGLFYGLAFWLMALVLGAVFRSSPEYTMTVASGCLLLGPFMAMGLYDVSRRREKGEAPALGASLTCWDAHLGSMGMLVLVLIVLELLWGRASLVVFAVFFNTGMPSTTGVSQAVFNPENWEFLLAYTLVGGAFAVITFSIAVVSIPTILDRDADAISAAITSLQVVFSNGAVMTLWGLLIAALVAGALLLPWGAGLVLVGPWLGHASWHAYRGAVCWSSAP